MTVRFEDPELAEEMYQAGVLQADGPEGLTQYLTEKEAERQAEILVGDTLAWLLRKVGHMVWHYGDGHGGWFVEQVLVAAEDAFLPVPEHHIGLPPKGPTAREIYERDAYRCQKCGDWHELSIDHIIPRSRGGTNDPRNLRVLCRSCNSRKGARLDEEMPSG